MPPPRLPLELLLIISDNITDDRGERRYGDFNAFLKVNVALYSCLNHILWQQAVGCQATVARALIYIIGTRNIDALKRFLEFGADVDTPLYGHINDYRSIDPPTPLIVAVDFDNIEMVRHLLANGAKVRRYHPQDELVFSTLHVARSAEMVELLLDYYEHPDCQDADGETPLYRYASRLNSIGAMRQILLRGADVNASVPDGTPLHQAAKWSLEAMTVLLEFGADVTATDYWGNTALHVAAREGMTEVVRFLMEVWPEGTKKPNNNNETPLSLAAVGRRTEVMRLLDV
jgi:ankyrin repeat protein